MSDKRPSKPYRQLPAIAVSYDYYGWKVSHPEYVVIGSFRTTASQVEIEYKHIMLRQLDLVDSKIF